MFCTMAKKASWHCGFGNKAFIFSLDVTIAVLVSIIVLSAAVYYSTSTSDSLPTLQMSRTGSDILIVLYYNGTLNSWNSDTIEDEMYGMLPPNYDMRINLIRADRDVSSTVIAGSDLPENKMLVSGKRIFVRTAGNKISWYATAQYWIWLK